MAKTFFDIFPTPKFIDFPTAGISVNESGLYFIKLARQRGKEILESYGFEEIPQGVLENGEIKKTADLVRVLSDLKRKHDLNFVKVSLPEDKAFLFRTSLPNISDYEIREALKFKIEENVPISLNEAVFDFYVTPDASDNRNKTLVVTVFPKEFLIPYLEVFEKGGLRPILFKVESQAISEALIEKGSLETFLIINIDRNKTGLYLSTGQLVQFSSSLNLGYPFLDSSKLNSMGKKEVAIDHRESGAKIYQKAESQKDEVFKEEVGQLLSYWDSINSKNHLPGKIKKVIACGEGALNKNFLDYFSSHFPISLEQANIWTNIFSFEKYIPDLTFEESLKYGAAAGLAIPNNSKKPII